MLPRKTEKRERSGPLTSWQFRALKTIFQKLVCFLTFKISPHLVSKTALRLSKVITFFKSGDLKVTVQVIKPISTNVHTFSHYLLHQADSIRETESTLGTLFQTVRGWMQVISPYTTIGRLEVVKVREALRNYRSKRNADELVLVSAAWHTEVGDSTEDSRGLLVKSQVGCCQHPWACSQLPLVNNCLGFSSNFQILHDCLSLGDSNLNSGKFRSTLLS